MRTGKPISTISYNSNDFLRDALNNLVKHKVLSFWAFINHKAESYEKRDHTHVFMLPDAIIDTQVLQPMFDELHEDGTTSGVKLIRKSDWGNWYYYGLHDPAYLACKYENEQKKRYYYREQDIVVSDIDIACQLHETVDKSALLSPGLKVIREHALEGVTLPDFLKMFPVKKSDVRYVKEIYDIYGGIK